MYRSPSRRPECTSVSIPFGPNRGLQIQLSSGGGSTLRCNSTSRRWGRATNNKFENYTSQRAEDTFRPNPEHSPILRFEWNLSRSPALSSQKPRLSAPWSKLGARLSAATQAPQNYSTGGYLQGLQRRVLNLFRCCWTTAYSGPGGVPPDPQRYEKPNKQSGCN